MLNAMLLNEDDALRSEWSRRRRTAGRLGFLGGADATPLKESAHDGQEELRLRVLTTQHTASPGWIHEAAPPAAIHPAQAGRIHWSGDGPWA